MRFQVLICEFCLRGEFGDLRGWGRIVASGNSVSVSIGGYFHGRVRRGAWRAQLADSEAPLS